MTAKIILPYPEMFKVFFLLIQYSQGISGNIQSKVPRVDDYQKMYFSISLHVMMDNEFKKCRTILLFKIYSVKPGADGGDGCLKNKYREELSKLRKSRFVMFITVLCFRILQIAKI